MDLRTRVQDIVRELLQPYLYDGGIQQSGVDNNLLPDDVQILLDRMSKLEHCAQKMSRSRQLEQLRGCL